MPITLREKVLEARENAMGEDGASTSQMPLSHSSMLSYGMIVGECSNGTGHFSRRYDW